MEGKLLAVLNDIIDARLQELGLVTTEAEEEAPKKGKKDKTPDPVAAVGGKKGKPAVDFDMLKAKLLELVKEQSKDKAVAALARFGAKQLSQVKEKAYGEFYAYLEACISGDVDPEESGNTSDGEDDLL